MVVGEAAIRIAAWLGTGEAEGVCSGATGIAEVGLVEVFLDMLQAGNVFRIGFPDFKFGVSNKTD